MYVGLLATGATYNAHITPSSPPVTTILLATNYDLNTAYGWAVAKFTLTEASSRVDVVARTQVGPVFLSQGLPTNASV